MRTSSICRWCSHVDDRARHQHHAGVRQFVISKEMVLDVTLLKDQRHVFRVRNELQRTQDGPLEHTAVHTMGRWSASVYNEHPCPIFKVGSTPSQPTMPSTPNLRSKNNNRMSWSTVSKTLLRSRSTSAVKWSALAAQVKLWKTAMAVSVECSVKQYWVYWVWERVMCSSYLQLNSVKTSILCIDFNC